MTEIQQGIFKLLLELDDICKKHDITYYLIGGSVLGAIRHHGFLPWDDDIDIVLTKDNWNKLKKAFETDLPQNRAYVGWDNYSDEPSVFFRYVDTSQTFVLHSLWDHKIPWGGIIDIFVLNPLPESPNCWNEYHKTMRRFGEYIMNAAIMVSTKSSILTYFWDCFVGKIKSPTYVKNSLYAKLSQYSEEKCTHLSYLYARVHLVYPKEIFQEPRYVLFEGHMLPIPTLAEEHLRILYGDDWYNIPEDSEKIVHIAQHDTKRSYKEYMYDYLHYTDAQQVRKRSMRVKILKMVREKFTAPREKRIALLRAKYLGNMFTEYYEGIHDELESMYLSRDFHGLLKVFKPLYAEQVFPLMQKYQISIDIPEYYLEMAIYAQIASGYNRKAQKIMETYSGTRVTKLAMWEKAKDILDQKKDFFIAYETNDKDLNQMADKLFGEFPYDKDIRLMKIGCVLSREQLSKDTLMQLLQEATIGEAQWPNAAEFKKAQADIYLRLNNVEKASALYKEVETTTNNGMLLLQMAGNLEWNETGELIGQKQKKEGVYA